MDKNLTGKEKKYLKVFWTVYLTPFLILFLVVALAAVGGLGFMPTFEDLENPSSNLASEIYSEERKILGTYAYENRSPVEFQDLSPHLIHALIAREDHRFEKHAGIDFKGLGRVAVKTILLGRTDQGGGSTITQQLAKNLFPRDTTNYRWGATRRLNLVGAKFKEWVTAVKLERNYTKQEIITMYLNTVSFGSESYGIKSAAMTFFKTSPDSLLVEEAAILVGVLKGPTRYSPVRNPERAFLRRNGVLAKMQEHEFLTYPDYDSLAKLPIALKFQLMDHNAGPATYFREHLKQFMNASKPDRKRYFSYKTYQDDSTEWVNNPLYGWCKKNFKPDGSNYNLFSDGLRIYTTINSKMQVYAEEALTQHLRTSVQPNFDREKRGRKKAPFSNDVTENEIQQIMLSSARRTDRWRTARNAGMPEDSIIMEFKKPVPMRIFSWKGDKDTILSPMDSIRYYKSILRASILAMDPRTGHVKAYVGGPEFRYFKYDGVRQQKRQVGSTIKPFLYTLAMQEGYSPCDKVPNIPVTFIVNDTTYTPQNASPTDKDGEFVTLKWGLARSVNNISAWLVKRFNPQSVIDVIKKMGVRNEIMPVPSVVFGTSDITLYEMVGAYATFANKGVYTEPLYVTRVEDKNGNVLATFQPQRKEAISEQSAYLMLNLLEGVVRMGTAGNIRSRYNLTNPIGGKTGTTQNHSDGWFMGLTPDIVAGVWVGGEDRSVHFDQLGLGSGSAMALPIWALFMQKVYADASLKVSQGEFERPAFIPYQLNCDEFEGTGGRGRYDMYDDIY